MSVSTYFARPEGLQKPWSNNGKEPGEPGKRKAPQIQLVCRKPLTEQNQTHHSKSKSEIRRESIDDTIKGMKAGKHGHERAKARDESNIEQPTSDAKLGHELLGGKAANWQAIIFHSQSWNQKQKNKQEQTNPTNRVDGVHQK